MRSRSSRWSQLLTRIRTSAQHPRRGEAAAALARLLEPADEIAPHHHLMLSIRELRNGCERWLKPHASPHQFDMGKSHLPCRRPRYGFSPGCAGLYS
jgi:hypothetical protein